MTTVVSYFQARLGAAFSIAGSQQVLILSEVEPSANPQVFSLTFRGACELEIPQQTVLLERAGDETLAVFIVPAGRDGASVQYHATFNN